MKETLATTAVDTIYKAAGRVKDAYHWASSSHLTEGQVKSIEKDLRDEASGDMYYKMKDPKNAESYHPACTNSKEQYSSEPCSRMQMLEEYEEGLTRRTDLPRQKWYNLHDGVKALKESHVGGWRHVKKSGESR